MVLGMTPLVFAHVVISLVVILVGLDILLDLRAGQAKRTRTAIFLAITVATSLSGFLIPPQTPAPSPPQIVGVLSIILLAVAIYAFYVRKLADSWGWIYAVTALLSLYLNVFVLVVQGFLKLPPLHDLAPTGTEPPFAVTQGAVLILFMVAIYQSVRRIRQEAIAVT